MIGYLSDAIVNLNDLSISGNSSTYSFFQEISGDITYQAERIKNHLHNDNGYHSIIDDLVPDFYRIQQTSRLSNKNTRSNYKNYEQSDEFFKSTKQCSNDISTIKSTKQLIANSNQVLKNSNNHIPQCSESLIGIFKDENIRELNIVVEKWLKELGYKSYIFDFKTKCLTCQYCEGKDLRSADKSSKGKNEYSEREIAYACKMIIYTYVSECWQTSNKRKICEMIMTITGMRVPKNIESSNFYKFLGHDLVNWKPKLLDRIIDIFKGTSFHQISETLNLENIKRLSKKIKNH